MKLVYNSIFGRIKGLQKNNLKEKKESKGREGIRYSGNQMNL